MLSAGANTGGFKYLCLAYLLCLKHRPEICRVQSRVVRVKGDSLDVTPHATSALAGLRVLVLVSLPFHPQMKHAFEFSL